MEAEQTTLRLTPVPRALTRLIGREEACSVICARLTSPEVRLLTLTGTGGVGKTRLALAVAEMVQDAFADGVCFVPLAALRDPALVLPMVAQAVGLEVGAHSSFAAVRDFCSQKQMLLVLDNLEHLLTAAPPFTALLAVCPDLKLLVTSRERLHVEGEHEYLVRPLEVPEQRTTADLSRLMQTAAVQLLIERAQQRNPAFVLTRANASCVATICTHLDGLPLALELAAARLRLFSPCALLSRLPQSLEILTRGGRGVPERHQALYTTIKWSYDLLSEEEQRLFRRISIFAGGCVLSALENPYPLLSPCSQAKREKEGERGETMLEIVTSLVDKSLLQSQETEEGAGESRLQMLETIRVFAHERLVASGEEEAVEYAYVQYYVNLAAEIRPRLDGSGQASWFAFLEAEIENLRAVLSWSLVHDISQGLRLAATLSIFWRVRGHVQEIDQYFRLALAKKSKLPLDLRATALDWAGTFALLSDDYQRAQVLNTQSYELYRELGNRGGMADSLFMLARVALEFEGEYPKARKMFEECLAMYRETKDLLGCSEALNELADIARLVGEYSRARALLRESVMLCRKEDDAFDLLLALRWTAETSIEQGRYAEAHAATREALDLARSLNDRSLVSAFLQLQGWMEVRKQGRYVESVPVRAWLEESLALAREIGAHKYIARALLALGQLALVQGNIEEGRAFLAACCPVAQNAAEWITLLDAQCTLAHSELAQGVSKASPYLEIVRASKETHRAKRGEVLSLEVLAHLATVRGEAEKAAHLWGMTATLRSALELPLSAFERDTFYDQALASARTQLGKQNFATIWDKEQQRSLPTLEWALEAWDLLLPRPKKQARLLGMRKTRTSTLRLTHRELEVLRLIAEGMTNRQIAEQLMLSVVTVNSYLRSIFKKLEVSTRTAALRQAIEHHLL